MIVFLMFLFGSVFRLGGSGEDTFEDGCDLCMPMRKQWCALGQIAVYMD